MAIPWRIERLADVHDRSPFCCGQPSLDDFLKKLAGQYDRRDFARTYAALLPPDLTVQGYYTLSGGALDLSLLPETVRKKLPRHLVPVACLGRLAVTQAAQGQKLGKLLLMDALGRCSRASAEVALYAVEVVAIDDKARDFYLKYGFMPLTDDPHHLYLSMKAIHQFGAQP
jgi:GNAT superfamily N-acetyltransferase